jgi:hypothetical protein
MTDREDDDMDRERELNYRKARALVDDARSGLYPLPDEILASPAWKAVDRLEAERARPQPELVGLARERVTAAILAAATGDDGDFPDGHELVEAEAGERAAVLRYELLDDALDRAKGEAVSCVYAQAERIIIDFLRPRFDQTLGEAKKVAAALADHGLTAEELLGAPRPIQNQYLGLGDMARRYEAIREARRILIRFDPPTADVEYGGIFALYKNLPDVWPTFRQGQTPPWPTGDGRAFLLWLVTSDLKPWLPLAAEQDDAYRAYVAALKEARPEAVTIARG